MKYLGLNDIGAYKKSFLLSNIVWALVSDWNYFEKKTIGCQFVRSVDSISANIAEGFGRFHKKEKIRFYRISFGSLYESLDWNEKAFKRNLFARKVYLELLEKLKDLFREINFLIKYTKKKLKY